MIAQTETGVGPAAAGDAYENFWCRQLEVELPALRAATAIGGHSLREVRAQLQQIATARDRAMD